MRRKCGTQIHNLLVPVKQQRAITELEYLCYHTDVHIANATQIIEDTSTDCLSHKIYSLLPL
jgi:hypothetical protein